MKKQATRLQKAFRAALDVVEGQLWNLYDKDDPTEQQEERISILEGYEQDINDAWASLGDLMRDTGVEQ